MESAVNRRRRSIALIMFCQVASLAFWFSASAAIPGLLAHGEHQASRFIAEPLHLLDY
jgi:hypothetical protein